MKIVFFGDSITDSDRNYSDPTDLGNGYVKIAAGKLRFRFPDREFTFVNRGVGGDRTEQLLKRIQADVLDEKPDIVVLQIGVNDATSRFLSDTAVSPDDFRKNYAALVTKIKATGATLLLLEPFVLKVADKQRFRPSLLEFNRIVREIAEQEGVRLIPLDEIFMGVTQDTVPTEFATDGIHPTHHGCRYIADLIIKELEKYIA